MCVRVLMRMSAVCVGVNAFVLRCVDPSEVTTVCVHQRRAPANENVCVTSERASARLSVSEYENVYLRVPCMSASMCYAAQLLAVLQMGLSSTSLLKELSPCCSAHITSLYLQVFVIDPAASPTPLLQQFFFQG